MGAAWARHAMCESAFNWTLKRHAGWGGNEKSDSGYRQVVGDIEKRFKCGKYINNRR